MAGRRNSIKGFSMIELLVVLVILGLLAGLVGPRLFSKADIAKVQTADTQIAMIKGALGMYRLDVGSYPTTENGLAALTRQPSSTNFWDGPYLDDEVPIDPWGKPYQYRRQKSGLQEFSLYSFGADGVEGGDDLNADIGFPPD